MLLDAWDNTQENQDGGNNDGPQLDMEYVFIVRRGSRRRNHSQDIHREDIADPSGRGCQGDMSISKQRRNLPMVFVDGLGSVDATKDLRDEKLRETDQPLNEDQDVRHQTQFAVDALESSLGMRSLVELNDDETGDECCEIFCQKSTGLKDIV